MIRALLHPTRRWCAALLGLVLLLAACSGDEPGGGGPVTPERIPSSLRISESSLTLDDGQTQQLSANVLDQNGAAFSSLPPGVSLQWSSSNDASASVGATGLLTANRPGQAQITATVLPQNLSASVSVTIRPVASALHVSGGDQQSGTAGAPLAQQVAVRVVDRHGEGVSNVQVGFAITGGGGSVHPASVTSDTSGHARAIWTLGTTAGAQSLEARASGLGGSPVEFQATGVAGAPAALARLSGEGQSAQVASALPQPLVVRVTDAHGNAVSGASVTWSVSAGGGWISPAIATSDAAGEARATWTLGTTAGAQTASAMGAGTSVAFSASATPGPAAALVKLSGEGQSASVATALPQPLIVRVTDAHGNAVGGAAVNWQVTGGGGSLAPAAPTTDVQGEARATWTLGTVAEANTASAAAAGASVSFSASATPGPAATLAKLSGDGQSAPAGSALPQPLVVRLTDAHGNSISGATVSFAVVSGGGSLQPTSATTAANGQAQSTWTLGSSAAAQSVSASAAGLTPVSFSATAQATTGSIEVTTQSTGTNPPSSYTVSVDGGATQNIGANGTLNIGSVQPGTRSVQLSGVPQHCSVTNGSNPRPVTVTAGQTAEVSFQVNCSAATGSIQITTQTTGTNPPSSYTVSVDGGAGQSIGANATLIIANVQPGTRSVQLGGIPSHCTVTNGPNPRPVEVIAGQTAEVGFQVNCSSIPPADVSGTWIYNASNLSGDGLTCSVANLTLNLLQNGTTFSGQTSGGTLDCGGGPQALPSYPVLNGQLGAPNSVSFDIIDPQVWRNEGTISASSMSGNAMLRVQDQHGTIYTLNGTFSAQRGGSGPTTGSIQVTTQTTGQIPGGNYTVTAAGQVRSIGPNATETFANVAAGTHTVQLSNVPGNCTISGGATRQVNVTAGQTVQVSYQISCSAMSGSIQVTTQTTGTNPPSSYSVSVDGGAGQSIGANGSLTISNVQPGTRSVQLSGIPQHCGVINGPNPRPVNVTAGQTAQVSFQVTCSGGSQFAQILVQPGFWVEDISGGGPRASLVRGFQAPNPVYCVPTPPPPPGTICGLGEQILYTHVQGPVFSFRYGLTPDDQLRLVFSSSEQQYLLLSYDQTADILTLRNPSGQELQWHGCRSAATPQLVPLAVIMARCPSAGSGTINVTTITQGPNQPSGYTVSVDGGTSHTIGVNGSRTITNVPAGIRSMLLSGVPGNCTVTNGGNPRQAVVLASQTTQVTFEITCSAGGSPPNVAGFWTYNANNLTGQGLTCTVANLSLLLMQSGSIVTGQGSSGTLNCGWGPTPLEGLVVQNGQTTAPNNVSFSLVDPTGILGPQSWHNQGTVSGNTMSGTATLQVRDLAGQVRTVTGPFLANRLIQ